MFLLLLFAAAFLPMVAEAGLAARHDRALREQGACEPAADVYGVMQFAYPSCFVAMISEAWLRGASVDAMFVAGAIVFAAAKGLKVLGDPDTGRTLDLQGVGTPRLIRVRRGPYKWLRHPNYVAVAAELAGFAVMTQAEVAGVVALILFGTADARADSRRRAGARVTVGVECQLDRRRTSCAAPPLNEPGRDERPRYSSRQDSEP